MFFIKWGIRIAVIGGIVVFVAPELFGDVFHEFGVGIHEMFMGSMDTAQDQARAAMDGYFKRKAHTMWQDLIDPRRWLTDNPK